MTTKVKGLFKGLKNMIFEEEKKEEFQIGLPTEVKHVAHIGWDGPTQHDPPSWMKDFKSAPLTILEDTRDNSEVQWVSEDSKRGLRIKSSSTNDISEVPKSLDNTTNDLTSKKDSSTKSRRSRKHRAKADQPSPDSNSSPPAPRRSRRKKSKESDGSHSARPNRKTSQDSNPEPEHVQH